MAEIIYASDLDFDRLVKEYLTRRPKENERKMNRGGRKPTSVRAMGAISFYNHTLIVFVRATSKEEALGLKDELIKFFTDLPDPVINEDSSLLGAPAAFAEITSEGMPMVSFLWGEGPKGHVFFFRYYKSLDKEDALVTIKYMVVDELGKQRIRKRTFISYEEVMKDWEEEEAKKKKQKKGKRSKAA